MSDNESVDSGMTEVEVGGDDVVPFNEVGDEDLEAFLTAEIENEKNPTKKTEPTGKTTTDDVAAKTSTNEQTQEVSKDPNAPVSRAEYEALLARLNGQEKKVNGQELLIQRRTSELGDLKKKLIDVDAKLRQKYQEALEESPADALDIRDALKENQKQIQEVDQEAASLERRNTAQSILLQHVPEDQLDVDGMAECLARDGIPPQYVEAFKQDPIGFIDGDYSPGLTLVHVAKRAQAEGLLKKLYPIAQQLAEEVKTLRANQGNVLKKVQQVAKQTPQMTASGSRPSKQSRADSIDPSQIPNLSDEELDELLNAQN